MPGVYGIINTTNFSVKKFENISETSIKSSDYFISKHSIEKFKNDKVFFDDERFSVLVDGVILNSNELSRIYIAKSWPETIIKMYENLGETFMDSFRGSFCGVFCDKESSTYIIFTNHSGDKPVFYCALSDRIIFSYRIDDLKDVLIENKEQVSFNIDAAYQLVTYGFMLEDSTIVKQINRLTAGKYIKFSNGSVKLRSFYKVNNDIKISSNEDKLIDRIDELFRYAVKLEFEKDIEYGYDHLAGLSGGLDSRMTTWVANDMGYNNITNYTFSKSNYLDFRVAQQIASALGNKFIFKSLDDLQYIKDIDSVINNNGGTGCASGHIHGKSFLELINFNRFGLIHTGQLGDVVLGTFSSSKDHRKPLLGDGAYSNILIDRIDDNHLKQYENEEIYKMYNRGFNGALNSHITMQNYSEVSSPFILKEFFDFCLSIDPKLRLNHQIYYKWILEKYPEAGKFVYEKYNAKINSHIFNNKLLYLIFRQIPKKISQKNRSILFSLGITNSKYSKNDMNPFQYWFDTDAGMRDYIYNSFEKNITEISKIEKLSNDIEYMFKNSLAREKLQILSLLVAYNHMFVKGK
ncbi:hypothetical protein JHL18_20810 [Clostridium sp. YIM B02505]|uniref:asparagine synthase (glutamine-hydrolyzing) n=1 Tax=Clostridium yunnanense TaxID=2800325 RepID=A0ABS1EUJ8_9CLOT|nr:asparagine synthase-related protein [Clostridium yunnanense]MBK1813066.1 hypothetical protein [Clostridium yunnanense]